MTRFKYWFGGTVEFGRFAVGCWPFVWLRPKVYRVNSGEIHWPFGPLRFICR